MSRVLLWDFDGTLAARRGMWAACMLEALDEEEAGHGVELDAIRPLLRDGFPWHTPATPHPELCEPDAWWTHVRGLLARAYEGLGIPPARAEALARDAQARYVDAGVGWSVFDDVVPALSRLHERGWTHLVLSNHVPELPALVDALGLAPYFEAVFTSAATGFEKPHPEAYAIALRGAGAGAEAWMVGDSYEADVAGAQAVGLRAVLARTSDARARYAVATLDELDGIIA
jgi:putative hydrolase of the HAD superfamily